MGYPPPRRRPLQIDTATEFGRRAARRLREDRIAWLVSVQADGAPQPIPVWFLWDERTFLIFSRPNTAKLRNLTANPRVALHLDGDGQGGDIVVLTGEAGIVTDVPPADAIPEYVTKYREGIRRIGMTPDEFARAYSVAIRVTPRRIEGH